MDREKSKIQHIQGNEETICGRLFLNDGCLKAAQQFGMLEVVPVELGQSTRVEVRRQKINVIDYMIW